MPTADEPMPRSSVQQAFTRALKQSRVHKPASVRTLSHSYATHLLEAGLHVRVIQHYLDHNSPATTSVYTHLTVKAQAMAIDSMNDRMQDLSEASHARPCRHSPPLWPSIPSSVR